MDFSGLTINPNEMPGKSFFFWRRKALLSLTKEVTLINNHVSDITHEQALKVLGKNYLSGVITAININNECKKNRYCCRKDDILICNSKLFERWRLLTIQENLFECCGGICPAASFSSGNKVLFNTKRVHVPHVNAIIITYSFLALPLLKSATSSKTKMAPPTTHIHGCWYHSFSFLTLIFTSSPLSWAKDSMLTRLNARASVTRK